MKKNKLIISCVFLVSILSFLSGCSGMQEAYRDRFVCNTSSAYSAGEAAGKKGAKMRSNYASSCLADQEALNTTYEEAYKTGVEEHKKYLENHVCNKASAFSAGVNSGKKNKDMQDNYAGQCSHDKAMLNDSYIEGYRLGLENAPKEMNVIADNTTEQKSKQCLSAYGKKVCGYDCKESRGKVQCAQNRFQTCVVGAFGEIACGYGCAQSSSKVACSKNISSTCVADNFDIKCGTNCRVEYGSVKCDTYDEETA